MHYFQRNMTNKKHPYFYVQLEPSFNMCKVTSGNRKVVTMMQKMLLGRNLMGWIWKIQVRHGETAPLSVILQEFWAFPIWGQRKLRKKVRQRKIFTSLGLPLTWHFPIQQPRYVGARGQRVKTSRHILTGTRTNLCATANRSWPTSTRLKLGQLVFWTNFAMRV